MTHSTPEMISDGRGGLAEPSSFSHLAVGTMVSRDLDAAKSFYEDFLGLEAVRDGKDRMLLRDRRAKHLMESDQRDFFVIEVNQVDSVEKPQKMLNHWGIAVDTQDEVRRIYDYAKAHKDDLWIKHVRPISGLHESYGFMLIDKDDNWWEIEHRGSLTNDNMFSRGDYDNLTTDESKKADPHLDVAETSDAIVGPRAFMTHGTVDVVDLLNARAFYEQVLGLRSVLRSEMAQFTAGGSDFTFVGVAVGEKHCADQTADNRWILLVDDDDALDARHARALALKDRFKIRQVTPPSVGDDGHRSFLIESADSNWFEFSTRPRQAYASAFRQLESA